jgi:hypothetical protein
MRKHKNNSAAIKQQYELNTGYVDHSQYNDEYLPHKAQGPVEAPTHQDVAEAYGSEPYAKPKTPPPPSELMG